MARPGSSEFRPGVLCLSRQCHSAAEGLRRGACNHAGRGCQPPRPGRRRRLPAPARLRDSPRGRTHHSHPCQVAHTPPPNSPALRVASGWTGHGEATPKQLQGRLRVGDPGGPWPLSSSSNPRGHARVRRAPPDLYFPSLGAEFARDLNEELLASGRWEARVVTRERPPRRLNVPAPRRRPAALAAAPPFICLFS